MKRLCADHPTEPVIIAADYVWYMERITRAHNTRVPSNAKPSLHGCPHDCGLCTQHGNTINLPVFSITNDCNLDCPICFTYNRPDMQYYKSLDDVKRIIEVIRNQRGDLDVINLTGGEPTLHPNFFEITEYLRSCGFKRITINTNGIRVAHDEDFAERLGDSHAQMVLSLNTFDPDKSIRLHGRDISQEKRMALAAFEKHNVPVTILCVAVRNFNETDLSSIVSEYIRKPFVKNIVIQNMTFTGMHGSLFHPREHITIDQVESFLEQSGSFSREDFFPLGSSHPLCYSAAYYFVDGDLMIPITRIIPRERLIELTSNGYLISPDDRFSSDFLDGINRLWADGECDDNIALLRSFFKRMYPADKKLTDEERAAVAESSIKSIYIHSHMDEDTIDLGRVSKCGDIVPDESGALAPACSYNLLYRENDERFWHAEK